MLTAGRGSTKMVLRMFRALWRLLFGPAAPEQPRLSARVTELENQNEDLLSIVDFLRSEVKKIRGRQFALEKHAKDDVGPTIDEQADEELVHRPGVPVRRSDNGGTAHLARRFKGG